MKITISGPIGSGKSTVGRLLAKLFDYEFFSGGYFFREQAKEHSMSVEEFNVYAEEHPEIDIKQDNMIVEFLRSHDNVVVESRLAGWMCHLKNIPAFKVFLTASFETRLSRIVKREGQSATLAEMLRIREESEKKRYLELYSIDYGSTSLYDLVIESDDMTAQKVAEAIYESARIREVH